jgi:hypothetical protein
LIGYNNCVYPGGGGGGGGGGGSKAVMNKYVSSDKVEKKNGATEPKVSSSLSFLLIFLSLIFHVYM